LVKFKWLQSNVLMNILNKGMIKISNKKKYVGLDDLTDYSTK